MVGDALALEAHVAHLDAEHLEVVGVLHVANAAGGGEERFGGTQPRFTQVPPMSPPSMMAVFITALHSVERGAVAADAGADDDKIVVVVVRGDVHGERAGRARGGGAAAGEGARSSVSRVWVRLSKADAIQRADDARGRMTRRASRAIDVRSCARGFRSWTHRAETTR